MTPPLFPINNGKSAHCGRYSRFVPLWGVQVICKLLCPGQTEAVKLTNYKQKG